MLYNLPVNSPGLLPFRSFLLTTGDEDGEFFLRVCTLGGAGETDKLNMNIKTKMV